MIKILGRGQIKTLKKKQDLRKVDFVDSTKDDIAVSDHQRVIFPMAKKTKPRLIITVQALKKMIIAGEGISVGDWRLQKCS